MPPFPDVLLPQHYIVRRNRSFRDTQLHLPMFFSIQSRARHSGLVLRTGLEALAPLLVVQDKQQDNNDDQQRNGHGHHGPSQRPVQRLTLPVLGQGLVCGRGHAGQGWEVPGPHVHGSLLVEGLGPEVSFDPVVGLGVRSVGLPARVLVVDELGSLTAKGICII